MTIAARTVLWAGLIFCSGIVVGLVSGQALRAQTTPAHPTTVITPAALIATLARDLHLRPEQLPALHGPASSAVAALRAGRQGAEEQMDATYRRLATELAPMLDDEQRAALDRRLLERTRRWQQRLAKTDGDGM